LKNNQTQGKIMKTKRIVQLSSVAMIFISTLASAEEATITDSFDSGLSRWDKPSSSAVKIVNEELTNKTKYAGNIRLAEKEIASFTLSFRLKLLKKTSDEPGHIAMEIDRGNGKWKLYLTTTGDKAKIISKFYDNHNPKKGVFSKVIPVKLPVDKWLDITIICNNEQYKLIVGEESFILGTAPGKGGFLLGSYRQPFALDDFKIIYEKPAKEVVNKD
jgi:hypothetical protein